MGFVEFSNWKRHIKSLLDMPQQRRNPKRSPAKEEKAAFFIDQLRWNCDEDLGLKLFEGFLRLVEALEIWRARCYDMGIALLKLLLQ